MRDGVRLASDHYTPTGEPLGTVLFVTPYGLGTAYSLGTARRLAARGYHTLFVSCRGTFGSEGTFDAMRDDAADNQDIVAWLRDQPWYTGSFATYGASYLGYTQWALLADPPADLKAAVIAAGPHDFARWIWGTGTFNLSYTAWAHVIDTQEASNMVAVILQTMLGGNKRHRELVSALPILKAADAQFAQRQPWVRERLLHPDLTDPFWAPMRHTQALEKADVPILLITGWLDLFTGQSFEQYRRLRERDVDVALLAGPWGHYGASGGTREGGREMLAWLDDKLAGRADSQRAKPVHLHETGADEWREYDAWPPATQPRVLHLGAGSSLAATPAAPGAEAAFTFDPADPTPSLGGPLYQKAGYVNDAALAARADVLAFTGPPLPTSVEIAGSPAVVLDHHPEHPDADLFVRLSDVDERGRSRNVTEAYLRVQGGPVRVELRPAAHRFAAGHCVRLLVAGGSFPHFPPNPGTGENPLTATRRLANRHAIALPGSFLELPQIP
jgi:putative CocE/NonD family hydrolase